MSLFQYLPGGGIPRGGGPKLRNRKVPPIVARRRGQGVITGLAARRPAALLKRAGTLNRSAFNQVLEDCTGGAFEALLGGKTLRSQTWNTYSFNGAMLENGATPS